MSYSPSAPAGTFEHTPYRGTARVVGLVYLVGMVVGIGGNFLIGAAREGPDRLGTAGPSMLLALGVVLWLCAVLGDAAHGVLMFPVLAQHSQPMALGYLAARIVDAVLVAVMALLILAPIPLGQEYAYEFGMTALGVAGLILCSVLYRTSLIPRPLAGWGLLGYAILLGGSVLQILGFDLRSLHAVPGGLWEVVTGVWLIARGFGPPTVPSTPSPAESDAVRVSSP
jgi:hypothetical protein